jgi:membrane protein implicated in regulation of membrane protease activity
LVKLTPKIKFIAITIDELLLIPLLIALAYYFVPELLAFTIVASITGGALFVAIKYYLVYDSLKEGSYYLYNLEGTRCTVIEQVTHNSGKVKVGAEIWEARSEFGEIPRGTEAVIVSRENFKVRVKPWQSDQN